MQYLHDYGSANVAGVCFVDQSPRITTDAGWSLGLFGSVTQTQLQRVVERLRDSFYDTVIDEIVSPAFPGLAAAWRQQRWLRGLFLRALSKVSVISLINVLQSLIECDFRDVVQRLSVPAMVVLGGRSTHYGGLSLGDYYSNALGAATVKIYSMAGHSPHRQEPARFVRDLLIFASSRCI
jgi:pimeloyl-ACP methyl ester carboxylesterase